MIRSIIIYLLFLFSYLYAQENIDLQYCFSIKDAINDTEQVIALDLSNSEFHFLPDNISKLYNLQYLKLKNCRNLNLDNTFIKLQSLKKLKYLDLSWSYHKNIPLNIKLLENLETLILNHNQLLGIYDEIKSLKNLKVISLIRNPHIKFEPLFKLLAGCNLKEIDLSYNYINDIPYSFYEIASLEKVNFTGNNIVALHENISSLKHLKELNLSLNKSLDLKQSLNFLKGCPIEKLKLENLKKQALPEEISLLTQLKELFLNHTPITDLPKSIGGLTNLERLEISFNKNTGKLLVLENLPSSLGKLKNLKIFIW